MADVRLIDANALKEKLQADHDFYVHAWGGFKNLPANDKARVDELTASIAAVVNSPTISAVPVVHGRWEWYEDWGPSTWLDPPDLDKSGWKCSNCGIDLGDYLTDCLGVNVYVDEEDKMPKINSCPNCGAKMDGGADNV